MKYNLPRKNFNKKIQEQKSPQPDSRRSKRELLKGFKVSLEQFNNRYKELDIDWLRSNTEYRLALKSKRAKMRAEIRVLEFQLLSPDNRVIFNDRVRELHEEIESFKGGYVPFKLRIEYRRKSELLSDKELDEILNLKSSDFSLRRERRLEKYENAAHEAVERGIARLASTFNEVLEQTGSLPTAIIYPETSSRPLRYAVKPLVDSIYPLNDQAKPGEYFVNIFASVTGDGETGRDDMINFLDEERLGFIKEKREKIRLRKQQLTKLKREKNKIAKEELSVGIHLLWNDIEALNDSIRNKEKELKNLATISETKELEAKRIDEVQKFSGEGPVLVIDDVLARGRTFGRIDKIFKDKGVIDVYYFAFIGSMSNCIKNTLIDRDKISLGVIVPSNAADASLRMDRIGYHPSQSSSEFKDWDELMYRGFPYRCFRDDGGIGVKKDFALRNHHASKADVRDNKLMNEIRVKYRGWGDSALAKIDLNK